VALGLLNFLAAMDQADPGGGLLSGLIECRQNFDFLGSTSGTVVIDQ
jgi:hypothetical protein